MREFQLANNINEPSILKFLMGDDKARIYHHPAWLQSLSDSYGGKPVYVLLREDGEIRGIAPFILSDKGLSKKKIISLPFTNYCDYILPEDITSKMVLDYINSQLGPISEFDLRVLSR